MAILPRTVSTRFLALSARATFWLLADVAFANPETYEYCEEERITYFIKLPSNASLECLLAPHLSRPVGRSLKSGIKGQDH
jgi:hypothetical protein